MKRVEGGKSPVNQNGISEGSQEVKKSEATKKENVIS